MSPKISIRFYKDREVRAIWDEESSKWWFAVVDIVNCITDSANPRKYWSVLKIRLKKQSIELTTICSQLKIVAADGKRYLTDCIPLAHVSLLVKHIPSKNSIEFLDWLTYSDNTIDGQSQKKAYDLYESSLIESIEVGTVKGLQQIHGYLFGGLYDFAGQIRSVNIAKGGFQFAMAQYLPQTLSQIEQMPEDTLDHIIDKYVEMNIAHPFREGNGRSTRIWLDLMLKKRLRCCVDWSRIDKFSYLNAMTQSVTDASDIKKLIAGALTDKIADRETFMRGIDYSYYYEQND